jgi:hypothetical protein
MPSTTRKPLPPATETLEAFHVVGSHVYLVRYRPGQEELARESIYRFSAQQGTGVLLDGCGGDGGAGSVCAGGGV